MSHLIRKCDLLKKIQEIFESLTGLKDCDLLSSTKFRKLAKFEGIGSETFNVTQFDLLFASITNKIGAKALNLYNFFDALEILYGKVSELSNQGSFETFVDSLHSQISS